ncbi:hypothetical protein HDF16_003677 [Granulicella aggregans]|uniref:Squalene-hopene cyclase-like protein n=1 Tax=Granulicella aggregans TaxID=474949 RepID=A0A7W8E563_9BACT|nr:hypothetical protein [Granulicella aggregans]MBB5058954.1 hypothetical protein [Granulicella aggregans]
MKLYRAGMYVLPALCLAGLSLWRTAPVHGFAGPSNPGAGTWDKAAAAKYLDDREVWWQGWPRAQKDHGTVCISCHTNVPYAMARPALRAALHETSAAAPETVMIASVEKRVGQWGEVVPFYSDAHDGAGKTAESHSTEAVMNAVILLSYDANLGRVRPITRTALDEAWALQLQAGDDEGGWIWQNFHLSPWESNESSYQGAAMLMLELASTSPAALTSPEDARHLGLLKSYLRKHYAEQPLLNQLYVYWASAKASELLDAAQHGDLLARVRKLQQSDGGWKIASLDSIDRIDKTAQPAESDGYATALVALALEANVSDRKDASLRGALTWLEDHQGKDGRWQAASLNKQRDPESNIGKFMSDTATAYAALALEQSAAKPAL